MTAVLLLAFALAVANPAAAQDTKIAVAVSHFAADEVGRQNRGRSGSAYSRIEVYRFVDDEVTPEFPRIVVRLRSVSVAPDSSVNSPSAISETSSMTAVTYRVLEYT